MVRWFKHGLTRGMQLSNKPPDCRSMMFNQTIRDGTTCQNRGLFLERQNGIIVMSSATKVIHPFARMALATVLACMGAGTGALAQAAPDAGAGPQPPRIETHATAGFRLYRPGYRLTGKGVLVSAQVCRIPFWAAAGPQRLRVELRDTTGQTVDSTQVFLPRLGLRPGNNCAYTSARLNTVPDYGTRIEICLPSSRRTTCT
jgi:hypothetical protein